MDRKALSFALVLLLTCPASYAQAPPTTTDPEVVKGIALVEEGDYDAAIVTLDKAARRLAEAKKQPQDLSQAYLYLGIAYVGKGHEAAAKAKFKEALGQIRDLTLSADRFPPKVINTFEAAKEEAAKAAPPQASAATTAAPTPAKKGGSGKILLIVGGLAAAGGIAVAAGGGGDGGSSAPTTTTQPPDPRRLDTFTGTMCSYAYSLTPGGSGCSYYDTRDIVVSTAGTLDAVITWTNPNALYTLELLDQDYQTVARSNRITNTESRLSSPVSPQTACATCAYHVAIGRQDEQALENFTLNVRHP
jgi:tetratricopeptide (TPR) repeat protein